MFSFMVIPLIKWQALKFEIQIHLRESHKSMTSQLGNSVMDEKKISLHLPINSLEKVRFSLY